MVLLRGNETRKVLLLMVMLTSPFLGHPVGVPDVAIREFMFP
jgi:hypothetical protein